MGKRKHYKEIVAWAEGKQVQIWNTNSQIWVDNPFPGWSDLSKYRVKPEPEYIPFDFSDAEKLIGKVVINVTVQKIVLITEVDEVGVKVWGNYIDYKQLLKDWRFFKGDAVCGKLKT